MVLSMIGLGICSGGLGGVLLFGALNYQPGALCSMAALAVGAAVALAGEL